jgi:hypothetical protein
MLDRKGRADQRRDTDFHDGGKARYNLGNRNTSAINESKVKSRKLKAHHFALCILPRSKIFASFNSLIITFQCNFAFGLSFVVDPDF